MLTIDRSKAEEAADYLEFDLRDSADELRDRAAWWEDTEPAKADQIYAAAERCEELADDVGTLDARLLAEYADARAMEDELAGGDGPIFLHASMTMEIGSALNPSTIEELVRIYIRAVGIVRADPSWANVVMEVFWVAFARQANSTN